jgi:hypothetical protein
VLFEVRACELKIHKALFVVVFLQF